MTNEVVLAGLDAKDDFAGSLAQLYFLVPGTFWKASGS